MTDDYTVKELAEWLNIKARQQEKAAAVFPEAQCTDLAQRLRSCASMLERLAAENERQNRICAKYSAEAVRKKKQLKLLRRKGLWEQFWQ
jgi:hypothetical protein